LVDDEEIAVDVISDRTSRPVAMKVGGVVLALAGIGIALSGCAGSSTSRGAPSAVSAPLATTASPKPTPRGPSGITGQITAMNGSTWTVVNKAGKQFTITITPETQFGTKRQPATEAQFSVGNSVRVIGTVNATTVTAARVEVPQSKPVPSSSAPMVAPTTTS
jgi:hypothetical protein